MLSLDLHDHHAFLLQKSCRRKESRKWYELTLIPQRMCSRRINSLCQRTSIPTIYMCFQQGHGPVCGCKDWLMSSLAHAKVLGSCRQGCKLIKVFVPSFGPHSLYVGAVVTNTYCLVNSADPGLTARSDCALYTLFQFRYAAFAVIVGWGLPTVAYSRLHFLFVVVLMTADFYPFLIRVCTVLKFPFHLAILTR